MKKDSSIFSKDYFTTYYKPMTGDFEEKDLVRNMRWFHGWFAALQDWYDFRVGKKRTVLELGCAIGAASRILAERGFKVTATDISEYAVKQAGIVNKHPNLTFKELDLLNDTQVTTFKNKYDLVFAFEVLEHLEDSNKAVKNLFSVVKKGGRCICSVPYPYNYVFIDTTHVSVRHPIDWERRFLKAGFTSVKYKQVGFVPYLYRFSEYWHITLPFGLPTPYINSPVFIYATKA
jgi:2-polyprenyl-3-methyl-5-hydroxy-6-metoxy-1,4-benzoquinol methylase